MASLSSVNALLDRAHRESNLGAFDGDSFVEGLRILIADADKNMRFSDPGRTAFENNVVAFLKTRLKIEQYVRENPDVTTAPIKAPVVVLGMPRTGTTLLSNLLATDPARRSLLSWEAADPVPPPAAGALYTDPRALAQLEIETAFKRENPAANRFYNMSAIYPTECLFVTGQDFKAMYWESAGRLPAYSEYMLKVDMTSAYDYHRLFLQVLQHRAKGAWNLKMPSHALHIEGLLKAYPDARIVWTHRDPYTAMSSVCSLLANGSQMQYASEPDKEWVGQNYPHQIAEHVRRAEAARNRIGRNRMFDSYYADVLRDPISSMRNLYAWLGDEFTPEVEAGMRAWLAENPQGKFGKHEYKLAEYGLSVEKLKPYFADYAAEYRIESEGKGV